MLYYNILSIFSYNSIKSKFCINCKYFKKNYFSSNEFGKCILFPIQSENIDYLVTGKKYSEEFYYCKTARNNDKMCGKEGLRYIKKIE